MRVAWVQDISRPHGGAECSNRTVVAAGERLGHDIVGITPQNFHEEVLREAEVLVVNNFFQFSREQERSILSRIWNDGLPYVVYSHDARDTKRLQFSSLLFGKSRLNVYISPRHRDVYRDAGLGDHKELVLPLAIDVALFREDPAVRRQDDAALIVGGWVHGGKVGMALRRFMRENNRYRYLSVGLQVDGAEVVPKRPLEKMPGIYSYVSALVHFPDMECAGERIVFEAALCGVREFHLGEKVGHASWGFDLSDREGLAKILRDAPVTFWQEVERAARG